MRAIRDARARSGTGATTARATCAGTGTRGNGRDGTWREFASTRAMASGAEGTGSTSTMVRVAVGVVGGFAALRWAEGRWAEDVEFAAYGAANCTTCEAGSVPSDDKSSCIRLGRKLLL